MNKLYTIVMAFLLLSCGTSKKEVRETIQYEKKELEKQTDSTIQGRKEHINLSSVCDSGTFEESFFFDLTKEPDSITGQYPTKAYKRKITLKRNTNTTTIDRADSVSQTISSIREKDEKGTTQITEETRKENNSTLFFFFLGISLVIALVVRIILNKFN